MVKAYKEHKVSELKELLTQRGLPVSGTKNELIARLEANDQESKQEETTQETAAPAATDATETKAEPVKASTETPAETSTEKPATTAEEPKTDAKAEASTEPQADPTQIAIEELEKRIERARRFGDSVEELEQQLKRIKRFGYTPPAKPTRYANNRKHRRHNNQRPVKVSK